MKERYSRILLCMAALALPFGLSLQKAQAASIQADSNVNVRIAPDLKSEKIGYIQKGQVMDVIGDETGFYKILWNGQVAYTSMNRWTGFTAFTAGRANYRQAADVDALRIGSIEKGREVLVMGRRQDWLYIEYQGVRGFSWSGNWNVSPGFVEDLPHVLGELPLGGLGAEEPTPEKTPKKIVGDDYLIMSMIPGHETLADARNDDAVLTVLPGTYLVNKINEGMYYLMLDDGVRGVWIDPEQNTGRTLPEDPENPEGLLHPEWALDLPDESMIQEWEEGDKIEAITYLSGYYTSADAMAGREALVKLNPARYFIYRSYNGMLNLSASMDEPGAWVDPGQISTVPAMTGTIGQLVVHEAESFWVRPTFSVLNPGKKAGLTVPA